MAKKGDTPNLREGRRKAARRELSNEIIHYKSKINILSRQVRLLKEKNSQLETTLSNRTKKLGLKIKIIDKLCIKFGISKEEYQELEQEIKKLLLFKLKQKLKNKNDRK